MDKLSIGTYCLPQEMSMQQYLQTSNMGSNGTWATELLVQALNREFLLNQAVKERVSIEVISCTKDIGVDF